MPPWSRPPTDHRRWRSPPAARPSAWFPRSRIRRKGTPRTSVGPTGSLSDKAGTVARPHRSAARARALRSRAPTSPPPRAVPKASAAPVPPRRVRPSPRRSRWRPRIPSRLAQSRPRRDVRRAAVVAAAANEEGGDSGAWDNEPTVNIPISFFSILNLSPRAHPASVEAAYTAVIQRELVEGFSKACLAARADLVDAAAQVISDPALRIEHESDLKEGRLTPVPHRSSAARSRPCRRLANTRR